MNLHPGIKSELAASHSGSSPIGRQVYPSLYVTSSLHTGDIDGRFGNEGRLSSFERPLHGDEARNRRGAPQLPFMHQAGASAAANNL